MKRIILIVFSLLLIIIVFPVVTGEPILENMNLSSSIVYRGETVFISLNASDSIDNESDLEVQMEYSKNGTSNWTEIIVIPEYFDNITEVWRIPFEPNLTWDDDKLGIYDFHARLRNSLSEYSNGGAWTKASFNIEVKNNIPWTLSINAKGDAVERGSSLIIYANGDDAEKTEDELEVSFEYSYDGTNWVTTYLGTPYYNYTLSRWEVVFTPPIDADIGPYDFRVRFSDSLDFSIGLEIEDLVDVINAVPQVVDFYASDSIIYRVNEITLFADGYDADGSEVQLIPHFQYKGPFGDWVDQIGSNYFGAATFVGDQWKITFKPSAEAELGNYSFRVKLIDDYSTSDWSEIIDVLLVINNPPEITDIDMPKIGYRQDPLIIAIEVTDPDMDHQNLTVDFEYKSPSGNWTSIEDDDLFPDGLVFEDGEWKVDFHPVHETELGDYSFRVRVSDGLNQTEWFEEIDELTLVENPLDPDSDGLLNEDDDDDDGDGVLDINDALPLDPLEFEDTDSDGIGNNADTDDDDDGVDDTQDAFPLDGNETLDTDSDGIGNNADPDDDNDGILDEKDPQPLIPKVEEEEEPNMVLTLLLLIIILMIIIILVLLFTRKKKPEEVPHEPEGDIEDKEMEEDLKEESEEVMDMETSADEEIKGEKPPKEDAAKEEEPPGPSDEKDLESS